MSWNWVGGNYIFERSPALEKKMHFVIFWMIFPPTAQCAKCIQVHCQMACLHESTCSGTCSGPHAHNQLFQWKRLRSFLVLKVTQLFRDVGNLRARGRLGITVQDFARFIHINVSSVVEFQKWWVITSDSKKL